MTSTNSSTTRRLFSPTPSAATGPVMSGDKTAHAQALGPPARNTSRTTLHNSRKPTGTSTLYVCTRILVATAPETLSCQNRQPSQECHTQEFLMLLRTRRHSSPSPSAMLPATSSRHNHNQGRLNPRLLHHPQTHRNNPTHKRPQHRQFQPLLNQRLSSHSQHPFNPPPPSQQTHKRHLQPQLIYSRPRALAMGMATRYGTAKAGVTRLVVEDGGGEKMGEPDFCSVGPFSSW